MPGPQSGTKLKILRGLPGHHPVLPEPEPRVTAEVPPPPDYLEGYAKEEWLRLAPELHVIGLLTVADPQPFASYCLFFGRWLEAERALKAVGSLTKQTQSGPVAHPLVAIASKAASDMLAAAVQFGLTPAARRKLSAPGGPKAGKFDGLMQ